MRTDTSRPYQMTTQSIKTHFNEDLAKMQIFTNFRNEKKSKNFLDPADQRAKSTFEKKLATRSESASKFFATFLEGEVARLGPHRCEKTKLKLGCTLSECNQQGSSMQNRLSIRTGISCLCEKATNSMKVNFYFQSRNKTDN